MRWLGLLAGTARHGSSNWVKVKNVAFFRVKTFNAEESAKITSALTDDELTFDANGHIGVGKAGVLDNPIAMRPYSSNGGVLRPSADTGPAHSPTLIPNEPMTYVLHLNEKTSLYELLYNPIHRKPFKDEWLAGNETRRPWGGTRNVEAAKWLQMYCENMTVKNIGDSRRYMDPTCGLAIDQKRCAQTVVAVENLTQTGLDSSILVKNGASLVQDMQTGTPQPKCACMGPSYVWLKKNEKLDAASESFMSVFQTKAGTESSTLRECRNYDNIYQNCAINYEAGGDVILKDSMSSCLTRLIDEEIDTDGTYDRSNDGGGGGDDNALSPSPSPASPPAPSPAPSSSLPTPAPSLPAPSSSLPTPAPSLPAPSSSLPAPSSSLPAPDPSLPATVRKDGGGKHDPDDDDVKSNTNGVSMNLFVIIVILVAILMAVM